MIAVRNLYVEEPNYFTRRTPEGIQTVVEQIQIRNCELHRAIGDGEKALTMRCESYQFANFLMKRLGIMVHDFQQHRQRWKQENQEENQR
jgi:hypothetical protein